MKQLSLFITLVIFTVISTTAVAQEKVELEKKKFKVYGNCEMCKTKIESAAKSIEGVDVAKWNVNSQKLMVKFEASKTDVITIKKAIAEVGYDTKEYRATDETYNNLHHCCKYVRPKPLK